MTSEISYYKISSLENWQFYPYTSKIKFYCIFINKQNLKIANLRSKFLRIVRYGIHKLHCELAKLRIAKAANCEVYLYSNKKLYVFDSMILIFDENRSLD